mmetsp:Transcript_14495/g.29787  ORF Transcript_14495/g.29787 Transcript_14495/m.29787 type:complete len:263 (+) Transcript_14495:813-1601(+)
MVYSFPHSNMSLSWRDLSKPIWTAWGLVTVAGSCMGSPTASILLGLRWNGTQTSGSVAAAASSTKRSSTSLVAFMAATPAEESVQNITSAVPSSSHAAADESKVSRASTRDPSALPASAKHGLSLPVSASPSTSMDAAFSRRKASSEAWSVAPTLSARLGIPPVILSRNALALAARDSILSLAACPSDLRFFSRDSRRAASLAAPSDNSLELSGERGVQLISFCRNALNLAAWSPILSKVLVSARRSFSNDLNASTSVSTQV